MENKNEQNSRHRTDGTHGLEHTNGIYNLLYGKFFLEIHFNERDFLLPVFPFTVSRTVF